LQTECKWDDDIWRYAAANAVEGKFDAPENAAVPWDGDAKTADPDGPAAWAQADVQNACRAWNQIINRLVVPEVLYVRVHILLHHWMALDFFIKVEELHRCIFEFFSLNSEELV
jgi:hypothetical protein